MLDFFYDSLETLKQVKKPTIKEVINLTIAIVVIVIVASIFFLAVDGAFMNLYTMFYDLMSQ
ncbi:preprotein translocase subunit SecE [Candidatus Vampirococcus lugosii]|uniref:Preprotein translocase subunit SecE n=1 Tax=Candidatus Vampirococcus lugosii TaxID=2789015 RepID=A0ABS5QMQ6_9BACT|nr:preprotein translocase subunit SecE [Candidatus Vampirococcus lugosii]MBS8121759.1 putative protein translocase SecE subunit [Candidatus Vampirococcus lugosii]